MCCVVNSNLLLPVIRPFVGERLAAAGKCKCHLIIIYGLTADNDGY